MLFNGTTIAGESNKKTKTTITASNFEGYDMGLLGDIHKHQWLNKNQNIGYAGSLIQQNNGETLKFHGLIKWNVSKSKGEFVEMPNNYGYYTLYMKDNKNSYLIKQNDGTFKCARQLPHNLRIRILYKNTTEVQVRNYIALLRDYHNIIEYSYQNDETNVFLEEVIENGDNYDENGVKKEDNVNTNNADNADNADNANNTNDCNTKSKNKKRIHKKELNITDVDYQNKLILEQLNDYEDIEESDKELIQKINIESNKVFNTDELNETKTSTDIN